VTGGVLAVSQGGVLVGIDQPRLPAPLVAAAGERAGVRFLEFFASTIRNPHTRRAYARAVTDFLAWCEDHAVPSIAAVQPLHDHPPFRWTRVIPTALCNDRSC